MQTVRFNPLTGLCLLPTPLREKRLCGSLIGFQSLNRSLLTTYTSLGELTLDEVNLGFNPLTGLCLLPTSAAPSPASRPPFVSIP